MATFRTVERPATRPCICGSKQIPAKRYEATQTVDVWWCLDGCGLETPPLYADNVIVRRTCRWCSRRYTARRTDGEGTCSYDCKRRSAHYHQMMVRQGQQNRKREVG